MIKLTIQQLLDAASCAKPPSPLMEFFALKKPVAVSWANRDVPTAAQKAADDFKATRGKLVEELKGKPEELAAAMAELLKQEIELPGERVKVADLRGDIAEEAWAVLRPFIAE